MKLIIVESPTKAKTLTKFLGEDFKIEASMGHLRDLPKSKMGIDPEKNFRPDYVVDDSKKKYVAALKRAAKGTGEVILATDQDREGEAIAFHVKYLLGEKHKYSRIVFHEITKGAILKALDRPGEIDLKLVEAQQARRILDRLVGYKLSPVLWRKVRRGLSAGRVQSVAVRLIVEKEAEIEAFKTDEYWEVSVDLKKQKDTLLVDLVRVNGKKVDLRDKKTTTGVVDELKKAKYEVSDVVEKEVKKYPVPPFMTSTLQRTASSRFGWSAKKTMRTAQQLYEKGLITYHRTDSLNIAKEAMGKVRKYIEGEFGKEYLPTNPIYYKSRSKGAQEAHESIRPTKPTKSKIEMKYGGDKLYRLIWERFVTSQMNPALVERTIVKVKTLEIKGEYELKTKGERLVFDGWLKVNPKMMGDVQVLPKMNEGDALDLVKVNFEQKFTQPPTRFSEASLIKALEEMGIGRPSTYAPTISTIQTRNYIEKKEKRLYPTTIGTTVTKFLMKYFRKVMGYQFTAEMEADLDKIAEGEKDWVKLVKAFYEPFDKKVEEVIEKAKRVKIPVEKTGEKCPECKKADVVIRTGRFGKFLSCSDFPECKYTANYKQVVEGAKCEDCGGEVVIKKSRKGRQFYGCGNYPKCKWASWGKPGVDKKKKDREDK